MSKFKIGDRVKGEHGNGVITNISEKFDNIVFVSYDNSCVKSCLIGSLKRLISKRLNTKYKYVLKTRLLDDVYPKDMDKYVKVKVIK